MFAPFSSGELKQDWVQIYTVENDLIAKVEEFITSEEVIKKYKYGN